VRRRLIERRKITITASADGNTNYIINAFLELDELFFTFS
jgi:hypothetical protein